MVYKPDTETVIAKLIIKKKRYVMTLQELLGMGYKVYVDV
jgi:hypothetical protein